MDEDRVWLPRDDAERVREALELFVNVDSFDAEAVGAVIDAQDEARAIMDAALTDD